LSKKELESLDKMKTGLEDSNRKTEALSQLTTMQPFRKRATVKLEPERVESQGSLESFRGREAAIYKKAKAPEPVQK